MDQLIIPKLIFFFILITYLIDIVLILWGEILPWSLMGVKGLITYVLFVFYHNVSFSIKSRIIGNVLNKSRVT